MLTHTHILGCFGVRQWQFLMNMCVSGDGDGGGQLHTLNMLPVMFYSHLCSVQYISLSRRELWCSVLLPICLCWEVSHQGFISCSLHESFLTVLSKNMVSAFFFFDCKCKSQVFLWSFEGIAGVLNVFFKTLNNLENVYGCQLWSSLFSVFLSVSVFCTLNFTFLKFQFALLALHLNTFVFPKQTEEENSGQRRKKANVMLT